MQPTSPTGSRRAAGGFTLLELLLAISLGAIVSAAVYQSFTTAMDAQRRIAVSAETTQTWRFFIERLRADLGVLAVTDTPLRRDKDALVLETTGVRGAAEDAATQVRYELATSEHGGQLRRSSGEGADEGAGVVMVENVSELTFWFLGESEWTDTPAGHPRALRCEVTLDGAEEARRVVFAIEVDGVDRS